MNQTTQNQEPRDVYTPIFEDCDGNRFLVGIPQLAAATPERADALGRGALFIEPETADAHYTGETYFAPVNDVLPFVLAKFGSLAVLVVGGPVFDAAYPPAACDSCAQAPETCDHACWIEEEENDAHKN